MAALSVALARLSVRMFSSSDLLETEKTETPVES